MLQIWAGAIQNRGLHFGPRIELPFHERIWRWSTCLLVIAETISQGVTKMIWHQGWIWSNYIPHPHSINLIFLEGRATTTRLTGLLGTWSNTKIAWDGMRVLQANQWIRVQKDGTVSTICSQFSLWRCCFWRRGLVDRPRSQGPTATWPGFWAMVVQFSRGVSCFLWAITLIHSTFVDSKVG